MVQVHVGERCRWLIIRRSCSKRKRNEVVARIHNVESEVARDVCLRKYGARARVVFWSSPCETKRKPSADRVPKGELKTNMDSFGRIT